MKAKDVKKALMLIERHCRNRVTKSGSSSTFGYCSTDCPFEGLCSPDFFIWQWIIPSLEDLRKIEGVE